METVFCSKLKITSSSLPLNGCLATVRNSELCKLYCITYILGTLTKGPTYIYIHTHTGPIFIYLYTSIEYRQQEYRNWHVNRWWCVISLVWIIASMFGSAIRCSILVSRLIERLFFHFKVHLLQPYTVRLSVNFVTMTNSYFKTSQTISQGLVPDRMHRPRFTPSGCFCHVGWFSEHRSASVWFLKGKLDIPLDSFTDEYVCTFPRNPKTDQISRIRNPHKFIAPRPTYTFIQYN